MSSPAPAPNPSSNPGEVTRLLRELRRGAPGAADALVPLIYDELRRLASRHLNNERDDHTLQTTALAHEAYLKLLAPASNDVADRAHFFAIASQAMRQILIDSARARRARKRGDGARHAPLDDSIPAPDDGALAALAVNDALEKLRAINPRQASIVEMKFFAGMTTEEIALVLNVAPRTIIRQWNVAQAWLFETLGPAAPSS
jgi:RNA polymerase sigma-70 factor, ECF subfamily